MIGFSRPMTWMLSIRLETTAAPTLQAIYYTTTTAPRTTLLSHTTPTFFPSIPYYRPDVLDIVLFKLLCQTTDIFNLNELSTDYNPIIFHGTDSAISVNYPLTSYRINLKKKLINPEQQNINFNPANQLLIWYWHLNLSLYKSNPKFHQDKLQQKHQQSQSTQTPPKNRSGITAQNRIHKEWHRIRDPAVKCQFNSNLFYFIYQRNVKNSQTESMEPVLGQIQILFLN